ncbi:MAG: hypothetical protein HQ580_14710 [Planctomycetes bacterium]|nr:hypothetical protein [Planctomycetota bacterium]
MNEKSSLLIDNSFHRERVLKAIRDYNQLRKGTLDQGQENKPPESESGLGSGPGLFDGISEDANNE